MAVTAALPPHCFLPFAGKDKDTQMATTIEPRSADLSEHGLEARGRVHRNPTTALLYMHTLRREDGVLAEGGPLVVDTGDHTGRSPSDRFVVREPGSESRIDWGSVNQPLEEEQFDELRDKLVAHLEDRELYVIDAFAGADPEHRLPLRVVTDSPWHALFAKTLFIDPTDEELEQHHPEALVLHAPAVDADPGTDGTESETFIVLHPTRAEVLIGGTFYAGEIKKSIFSLMNDRLPLEGVLPMHCSANVDDDGRVALFFGLSGTGKTTLSADPERHLIGDDEHGWSDDGVFNFEGGCYAKVIHLSPEAEPQIFKTTDAFGILPPIARLSRDQAMFYFLSGFTAKLAGTEVGVTEPQPTFSACFGAPFLPQPPAVYADLLGEKLEEHPGVSVWLVNTGWTGGPFGEGERMPIAATRALLRASLSGALDAAEYRVDPVFGIEVPRAVPDVDSALLDPRSTWRDPEAYDRKAAELAGMFRENFARFDDVDESIAAAGPRA